MFNLSSQTWLRSALGVGISLSLGLAGCTAPDKTDENEIRFADTDADNDVTASSRDMADRLADAMTRSWEPPADDLTDEQWEQIRNQRLIESTTPEAADTPAPLDTDQPVATPTPERPLPDIDEPEPLTRRELLALLRQRIRESDDTPLAKALTTAAISIADPNHEIDPATLAPLSEHQRDRVELYHQLLLTLGQELAQSGNIQRHSIDHRLDELFRDHPLEIRKLALCRSVSGFGAYTPFESKTFLAGRDQRMIVYSEIDHFRPHQNDDGQYEVKLDQEVVLYNAADGLAVWRHEPVRITDQSKNRRRDFFVVQMVTLPARLSVGKYRMKVRITDIHGNSLDETTLPIELVADASLVRSNNP